MWQPAALNQVRPGQTNISWIYNNTGREAPSTNGRVIIITSRVTWKIHELKNHLATLPEARTVTLSIDQPHTVPSSQPRVELLRADWSPMHFDRLQLQFSNKKSSDS